MGNPRRIPISLLDPSPFESREQVTPLETVKSMGIIVPVLVRPMEGGRYEVVAGHRRVESAKREGLKTILCSVKRMPDKRAALVHYRENTDREELTALAKGRFFLRLMKRFRLGERQAARTLGISHAQVSLCAGLARISDRVVRGLTTDGVAPVERAVTMTKYAAVVRLPVDERVASCSWR